jgi:hypothetical protein
VLNKFPRNINFDSKSIKGIFVEYSMTNKTYRIYISSSQIVVESVNIKFNECTNKEVEKDTEIVGIKIPYVDDEWTEQ